MAAKRRRRSRSSAKSGNGGLPGFVWMLFGLAIGLSVALAVYLVEEDRAPAAAAPAAARPAARVPADRPARVVENRENNVDDNGEGDAPEQRFTFYEMLPSFEVVVADNEPRAVVEPGRYILQAGSFTRYEDADRRRAELALQGIESNIQRFVIDDKAYHRVRIGPIDDLEELNLLRSRLRRANIDVLRIRLDGN